MKSVSASEVKAQFNKYLTASAKEPIVVTRHGQPVAVLYGLDANDAERVGLASNPKFQAFLAKARKEIDNEGGIPQNEFWQLIERKHPQAFVKKPRKRKSNSARSAS
jgi:prevent-host-death family protein